MRTPAAPSLTISTLDNGRRLRLRSATGRETDFGLPDEAAMREHHHRLARQLQHFRDRFDGEVEGHPEYAATQLDSLARAANGYLFYILDDRPEFDRLAAFVQAACPEALTGRGLPPTVHIVNELRHHIPWEILPLFQLRSPAGSTSSLGETASAFVGYALRVERQALRPRESLGAESNPVLDARDYLQVRFLRDASYAGVREEVSFLEGMKPHVRIEGPYPLAGAARAHPTVAAQLSDPTTGVDGSRCAKPDQIVHFGCHFGGSAGTDWRDLELRFSDGEGSVRLTLDQLAGDLAVADRWQHPEADREMPLVFLNACGTAVIDPSTAISMMTPFDKIRSRGIIGTTARVPDRVAAKFSRRFYSELLAGHTVVDAVGAARLALLTEYANPLGLLYVYYGIPGLRALPVMNPSPLTMEVQL